MPDNSSNPKQPKSTLPVATPLDPAAPPAGQIPAPVSTENAESQDSADTTGTPRPSLGWRIGMTMREMTSCLVSLIVHVALFIALSLIAGFVPEPKGSMLIVSSDPGEGASLEDNESAEVFAPDADNPLISDVAYSPDDSSAVTIRTEDMIRGLSPDVLPTRASKTNSAADLLMRNRSPSGGGFQGRQGDRKGELLGRGGATDDSEAAVALALAWLAAHQWQDGGWRLGLSKGPCGGKCGNGGTVTTSTGATGLALLPFLGAGHTHMSGDYRDVVHKGLYYLRNHVVMTPHGADLQESTMYAQGIATIALCEAYAMTQDDSLRVPAQRAVDFICYAQHSKGGWRYQPGMPGDTTVFGWQMMALKSAAMAGLDVPSPVISLAERYLDSVQSPDGAGYGYTIRGKSPGPTSVGWLVRMYTGWTRDEPRMQRGIRFLANHAPSKRDMYFNYYATQVLHHYGGPTWPKWNKQMRDYLVRTQADTGHERGSWFFVDQHGVKGGRLYTTAMCAMILEVYYRHMPLYEDMAVDEDF